MTFAELLARLKASPRVRGMFTTGSAVTGLGPASDLDLAIILDRNDERLRTVFTTIDGRFGDLYVFDLPFLDGVRTATTRKADSWEGVFAARLRSGRIEHDPDGTLASLQEHLEADAAPASPGEDARWKIWLKLNYDLATNRRYFASGEPHRLRALEIRLLYGVMDAVLAHGLFRGRAWEGEKAAWARFDAHDPEFGALLGTCLRGGAVDERMSSYQKLIERCWHGPFQPWGPDFLVTGGLDGGYAPDLAGFWNELLGKPA